MDAKLILDDNHYYLETIHDRIGKMIIGTTDHELGKTLNYPFKLSKENCDEIFGFVDVNELAEENYPSGDDWTIEESLIRKLAFKNGFNKAMELNKDKLFSEEIIEDNFKGLRDCIEDKDIAEFYINLAKTIFCEIEPTEIEIEIEMDDIYDGIDSARIFTKEETMVPKLDENGCLILTKKK